MTFPESLPALALLLFLDGATFAFATTPLLIQFGKFHPPWQVALVGGLASALGSMAQLLLLRWLLAGDRPWMQRFTPSRARLERALAAHPSATFLALLVARATPLPDAPLKLAAAATGYPAMRYGAAIFLGALPYYFALSAAGNYFRPEGRLVIGLCGLVALVAGLEWWRRRKSGGV